MTIFAVNVTVDGRDYRIPPLPAIAWLPLVEGEDWLGIVPGLVGGTTIDDLLLGGGVDPGDLVDAGRQATEAAAGMRWWAACRLVKSIVGRLDLAGALVVNAVDPTRVSLGGYLAAAYHLLVVDRDQRYRDRLDAKLLQRPRILDRGRRDRDRERERSRSAAQFEAMYDRFGGG